MSIVSATSELQVCYGGNDASIDFTVEGGRPPYNIKVLNKYTNSPHLSLSNVIPGTILSVIQVLTQVNGK